MCGSWLHAAHASLWSLQPRVLNTPPAASVLLINHVNEEKTLRLRIDLLPERINNKRERGIFGLPTILLAMTQHFALQGLQIQVTAFYYQLSMVMVSVYISWRVGTRDLWMSVSRSLRMLLTTCRRMEILDTCI